MDKTRKFYLFLVLGLTGALFFLWMKIELYSDLEYESDLFTILQLSRDYWRGKPFLYENAYGYNWAIHNYYFIPLCAPFTLLLGGKGLFVAGFILMLWGLWLSGKILSRLSVGKGIFFLLIFFSPTAFFLWDNFHFGWHVESYYYPLTLILVASLILDNKFSVFLSALFIILNREDGIILALSIFIAYRAAGSRDGFSVFIKKISPYLIGGTAVFAGGIFLLRALSGGKSRINETIRRFTENYNSQDLSFYLTDTAINWVLLCGPVMVLAFVIHRKKSFILWCCLAFLPILAVNIYSGIYYFPDPKYGINWAPRLAGSYGYIVACLFLSLAHSGDSRRPTTDIAYVLVAVFVCYIQSMGLERLHYYPGYGVYKRCFTGLLPKKEPNAHVVAEMKNLAARVPQNYPVRMDWHLFALFDHTDLIWPNKNRKPYHAPRLLILSENIPDSEPIPDGFEKIRQIGKYGVWCKPEENILAP